MIKAFGRAGEQLVGWWNTLTEDWSNFLLVYLLVCGGAANIVAAFLAVRWCINHVRIV